MNKRTSSIILITLSALAAELPAAEPAPVDTSAWKCRTCPFEEGWSGELTFGLGYVSEDSFKFGEYTGLEENGGYFIGAADVRYRGDEGYFLDIIARDVGLDARLVETKTGRQGKYTVFVKYDELPHFISDSAATPFRGVGSDTLTLPPGWVRAGSTAGMTQLSASLRDVELAAERKRVGVGASFVLGSKWEYAMDVRHETKEGIKRIAGAFFFNTAQLIEPVDYVTDEINVSASYSGQRLQARFAYYGSLFRNGNESLTWENPYTAVVAGADNGQLALAPDNQFHQLLAAVGYQFTPSTRGNAEVAVGRMTQDEDFLSATVNPTLVVPALPRSSLDGKVDTLTAKLGLTSRVTDRVQLNGSYTHNDRDNKTPQAAYSWVTTDSSVNAPRTNLPYSFTRDTLKLSADYRMTSKLKGALGYEWDAHDRTFLEAEETRENTVWGKFTARAWKDADLLFRVARADRSMSNYEPVSNTTPPQNPLLRKYNMADRQRDQASLHASMPLTEAVTFGAGIDYARDDYSESPIGLTEAREFGLSANAAVMLGKTTSLHFFLSHQRIESSQAGSQAFSTPDWSATNDDTIDTAGIGMKQIVIEKKLDVGADLMVSRSHGEITMNTGVPSPPFPDLRSTLYSLKLYTNYQMKDRWTLYAAYWFERYKSDDWALDGVTPSTLPNVISLGETSPDYRANFITLAVRYRF